MQESRFGFRSRAWLAGSLLLGATLIFLGARPIFADPDGAAPAKAGEKAAKEQKIVLVVDEGKGPQRIEIENLGELKDGESREVVNGADGKKVTVIRKGEALVVKTGEGKELRIPGPLDGDGYAFASDESGDAKVVKKIVVRDGKEGGEPMMWMHHMEGEDGPGCGCPCCRHHGRHGHAGMGGPGDEEQVFERHMMRDGGPGSDEKVIVMHGGPGMPPLPPMPPMPPMIDAVIERLQESKSFLELDKATREKVLAALREQAAGGPGHRRVEVRVIEEKEGDEAKPQKKQ